MLKDLPLKQKMDELFALAVLSDDFKAKVSEEREYFKRRLLALQNQSPGLDFADYATVALGHMFTEVRVAGHIQHRLLVKFLSMAFEKVSEKSWNEAIEEFRKVSLKDIDWGSESKPKGGG
jgi:hypothetical protein